MRRLLLIIAVIFFYPASGQTLLKAGFEKKIIETLQSIITKKAEWALKQQPITVTAESSGRSTGGKHDFYSEGDYWWPNPVSADSPYIQRDGMTNPDNFVAHRRAMIRLSQIVGALGSAYTLKNDEIYVRHALMHCRAWFVDTATLMNPSLLFAQAIKGRATGRGIGIIDAIQLMEVVVGLTVMQDSPAMDKKVLNDIKSWFDQFLHWLTTHQYGKDEMNAANNHGTCWVMQVATFAKFTGNKELIQFCIDRFKTVLLPNQMAVDGSFPQEMRRTKPYGYSIFNLGVAQPFLAFGANAFNNKAWLDTWKQLDHSPTVDEVIRNLPVRNPLIWLVK